MAGIAEQQLAQLPATPAKVDRLGRAAGLERGSRTSGFKGLWVKLERSLQPYQLLERSEEKCDLAFGLGSNGCLGLFDARLVGSGHYSCQWGPTSIEC